MRGKVFGVVSLGCDKNRVDAERLMGEIVRRGGTLTDDPSKAQIIIVNTCAFLNAAREESINAVLDAASNRAGGILEKVVVTGCLPEKFIGELYPALTEGDVFLGVKDADALFPALERAYAGERVNAVGCGSGARVGRYVSTMPHLKYLKIADGCFNHCTYCLIPKIRGKYLSYPMEELVEEARSLGQTEELVLVAQDTTRYGEDGGKNRFAELIKSLSALPNIGHIRLLYCYPEAIDDALIEVLRSEDKVLKYLDIPMQHSEDRILKLMGRRSGRAELLSLLKKLRKEIPGLAVRSTFMAGFPSETEEEHRALLAFLGEAQLENCGFFAYSREPETPAYKMSGQVHPFTKKRWVRELYARQAEISAAKLKRCEGRVLEVVCDGVDFERQCFVGRTYFQAHEIDGVTYFTSPNAEEGKVYSVRVDRADTYDLFGHTVEE